MITVPTTHANFKRFSALWIILTVCFGFGGRAYAQCASPANAIVAENCLPGSPSSEWDVGPNSAGDPTIVGFATDISVNQGGTVTFKINTTAKAYTIDIYRMGYYGGLGARKIASVTPSVPPPQVQPACLTNTSVGLIDCGNWAPSATWQVPTTAVSGIYFAHIERTDTGGDSHIVFIVRNDTSHSNILYQTSDETWQAYNYYGAGSLYGPASPDYDLTQRSYKVSYNRPFFTRGFQVESDTWVFGAEFAMVQWLEQNGYDVTYFTGVDAARNGSLIQNHKVYMDSGHDEYWSAPHRASVQAARDAGVNLAFFSGNEVFWKTRWENSTDGTNTPYRTLVCYKETLAFEKLDPEDPPTWTGTWRDPSFSPPADGGQPENALTGTIFMVNGTSSDNQGNQTIKVPAADGKMRFWRNTAAASLAPTATYTAPVGTLGYEWDEDIDNGSRPAGLFDLSTATYTLTSDLLLDEGATYGAGTATHHMTMYRAPSKALVFSTGSIDWAWGLNSNHDNPFEFTTPSADSNIQQATVNLFADMGVQPATIQSGLQTATASTDTTPPISTITSPASGAALNTGTTVTVTGTATDVGGAVGGVEFSGDGGTTWHPATGRGSWTYAFTPRVTGSTTLLSRAVDDSANLETAHGFPITVSPQVCPCSVWNSSNLPGTVDSQDPHAVEVGLKFRADADGSVLGVRFYKASTNVGTHVGHLWTDTGTLLATATFTGESSSGWQQVNFSQPVAITANTTYVVSYLAPDGHYSDDSNTFAQSNVDNPPLHALANGVDGTNAVFFYTTSPTGGFPTNSYLSSNYWVDVVYTSSNTFGLTGAISGPGGAGATVTLSGTESLTTTADASGNYVFDGLVNGNYTVTPTNSGVGFSPASQAVTISGTTASGINFASTVTNPLSISGTISGGGSGATVTLGGAANATTTASTSGVYSFTGLLGGSYTVTPNQSGVEFTPVSQSVNLTTASATQVNFQAQTCNCISVWQPSTVPAVVDSGDGAAVELGLKFQSDTNGTVTGVRFYKAAANIGTHIGHLWSSTGTQLAAVTFTGETVSGWQQATFSTPVAITANTIYIISYFAPVGHYSADASYFATQGVDNPPLHALANSVAGGNDVFLYTSSPGGFPSGTYQSTNYWVDVLFVPVAANQTYTVGGTITGGSGATVTLGGGPGGTTTADASGNYSFTGLPSGSYTVTPAKTGLVFTPTSLNANVLVANILNANFAVPANCPCDTLWQPATTPGTIDSNDATAVELGVKIRADADGYIAGVRFYKAATNTGNHVGNLWSSTGTPLSSANYVNESASGWQQVLFSQPVPISANTTYIASYFAPIGHYSFDANFFAASGVDTPPLHALESGVDGLNGVFMYGSSSAFPASGSNGTNYWIDAVYLPTTTYSITGTLSGGGGAGATVKLTGTATSTMTADGSGNFSFSGLANGSYTVTPSATGAVFSPASQNVTISNGHALGLAFSSTTQGVTLSGTISGAGGAGATVNLTGAATATTTTNASGVYTFAGVANGSYTVTPTKTGFTMTPASSPVTISGANATANFSSVAVATFTISGTISGSGGSGATVSLTGTSTASTTASTSGTYTFTGLANGSYTVTPTKTGFTMTPASSAVTISGANKTANFSSVAVATYTISGTISGSGGSGATVSLTGAKTATATASASGVYSFTGLANGSYTVTPTKAGFTMTPASTAVTVSGANKTANFSSVAVATYTISGTISGAGGSGATVSLTGAKTATATANTSGVYSFTGLANGSYTVTPTKTGFTMTPASSAVTISGANKTANFSSVAQTFTLSGTISGAGGSGATVKLTGAKTATATASASGVYSFTGLANGSYTVTPTKTGFTMTPASSAVTVSGANQTANFSSVAAATFTLTGTISGAAGSGATVKLTGASTATVTASTSGVYTFTGLATGSYTVTPSKSGHLILPTTKNATVSSGNVAGVNFSTLF